MLLKTFVLGLLVLETMGAASSKTAVPPIPGCYPCEVRVQEQARVAVPPIPGCYPCEVR